MTLNKQQAAKALGISPRTLATRMKLGTVRYTKLEGAKIGEQSVSFTYQQLGIPAPSASPAIVVHDVPIAPQYEDPKPSPAPCPVDSIAQRISEDLSFAERYLAGEASDSCGNTI